MQAVVGRLLIMPLEFGSKHFKKNEMKNLKLGILFVLVAIGSFIATAIAFGKPIANSIWAWGVTRATDGTTFTVSSTRNARVYYTISISCAATIGSNASGTVKLQASLDGGSTWNDATTLGNSNAVTLAITTGSTIINTGTIEFDIPAGALCKFVTTTSGTTTVTWINGVEVTYE